MAQDRTAGRHTLIADLQACTPSAQVVTDRIFVDDDPVLTSAGITTGIDLALYIVEQAAGPRLAARLERRLVMYQRRGAHDPQMSPWLAHRNHMHPALHHVQDAMAREPERTWTLEELAEVASVSAPPEPLVCTTHRDQHGNLPAADTLCPG